MNPIRHRYANGVSGALPITGLPGTKVLSLLMKSLSSTIVVRQALVILVVNFGLCSLPGNYLANAAVVSDTLSGSVQSPGKIAWHSCEPHLENIDCAQVQVPLDWKHPDGPQITLSVARHRASKPKERIGSLFVNFGGPGVAGAGAVREAGADLDKLGGGQFDVVGWDPRGTGESTHVRCFVNEKSMEQFWGKDWTIPSTPASSRRYVPKTFAYAQRCAALSGSLLEHISTRDTVRDLDYLRQLVGDPKLTYRGLSYGTFLGQTYANMFPKLVRAIILDANIDPVAFTTSVEAALFTSGADTDVVFKKFLSLCQRAGPANCKLAGNGDVAARVRTLLERLRRGPIPAPRGPAPYELRYGDAQIGIWLLLGSPAKWPELADELNQAANGDGSDLAMAFQPSAVQASLIPAVALQCADKPLVPLGTVLNFPRVMQHLTSTDFLGSVEGWWLWAPCASWRARSSERYTGPWNATTENPILVIGNRFDPRTQFANSVLASRRLGNAVLLTLQGYGHTTDADPSSCINEAVRNYLVTTTTPPPGTVCRPNHAPFDPDFNVPESQEQPVD